MHNESTEPSFNARRSDFATVDDRIIASSNLAEVNGPVVNQSNVNKTRFGIQGFESFRIDRRHVGVKDSWVSLLLGQWLKHKELELEDDSDFKDKHPSNKLRIHSLVNYNGSRRKLLNASVNYARKSLRFVCYATDVPSDYEVAPVASFHPKLSERSKFYQRINGVGNSQDNVELNAHDNVMDLNDV